MTTITRQPAESEITMARELAQRLAQTAAAYPLGVQYVGAQMLLQALLATVKPASRTQAMAHMFRGIRENTKAYMQEERERTTEKKA